MHAGDSFVFRVKPVSGDNYTGISEPASICFKNEVQGKYFYCGIDEFSSIECSDFDFQNSHSHKLDLYEDGKAVDVLELISACMNMILNDSGLNSYNDCSSFFSETENERGMPRLNLSCRVEDSRERDEFVFDMINLPELIFENGKYGFIYGSELSLGEVSQKMMDAEIESAMGMTSPLKIKGTSFFKSPRFIKKFFRYLSTKMNQFLNFIRRLGLRSAPAVAEVTVARKVAQAFQALAERLEGKLCNSSLKELEEEVVSQIRDFSDLISALNMYRPRDRAARAVVDILYDTISKTDGYLRN
ncbi:MAG: hypothetical protein JXA66_01390, partial [Oligoflexia bacterium]|nr:hypothetical protein [Oligoflexia bacterium]